MKTDTPNGRKSPQADPFTDNELLFGFDPTPGIVAVEFSPPNSVQIYIRSPADGRTFRHRETFMPFLWEQNGTGPNMVVYYFGSWRRFLEAAREPSRPQHALHDPVQQYLTQSGRTLFKGMRFEDLRRMQIDIETSLSADYAFSNPERDPLLAITLSDSTGWEEIIVVEAGSPDSEPTALKRLCSLMIERDPDVIEGHNIFKFDLPYLSARASKLGISLFMGRDGSLLSVASRPAKFPVGGGHYVEFPNYRIRGRHIVDTYLLAQSYDQAARSLENFKLKDVARALGVAEKNRVLLAGGESIMNAYHNNRDAFCRYALADVRETRAVASLLSRSYFVQSQMFPYNYQSVITRGAATKVDSLFLREYLRRGHPIPPPPPKREFTGALCEVLVTGVIENVWHCDIASLYPSTILAFDCVPKSDTLGIFKRMVADLRSYRLNAKKAAKLAADPLERSRLTALQSAFKILINSLYGYLAFPFGHFADFEAAERVTSIGREILTTMRDWLMSQGAQIIELDTDGIYFTPPHGITIEGLQSGLSTQLPPGIEVEFDSQYQAMFSYKAKNAAFLLEDGRVIVKGGALRSRGREPVLRRYLQDTLRMLLERRQGDAGKLFDSYTQAISGRTLPIEDLCKSQALHTTLEDYRLAVESGSRNPEAAFELALKSTTPFSVGDRVSYYITAGKGPSYDRARLASHWNPLSRDEDVSYYLKQLEDVAKLFDEFTPGRSRQGILL